MRSPRIALAGLAAAACCAAGCDDAAKPAARPPIDSPAALVAGLEYAYEARDVGAFAALLAPEFTFRPAEPLPDGVTSWDADSELQIHRRMFRPDAIPAGERPIDPELHLRYAHVDLAVVRDFAEQPEHYFDPIANPAGVDPERWRALEAEYDFRILFELQGEIDYLASGRVVFVVLEDRSAAAGDDGRFVFWIVQETLAPGSRAAPAGVEPEMWGAVKMLYAGGSPVDSEAALVQTLARAYRERDLDLFAALLSDEPGAVYRFLLDEPDRDGGSWDRPTELCIHQRMFRPQDIGPNDTPLDPDLWVVSIDARATAMAPFVERPDLYRDAQHPNGLDAERWRVSEGTFRLYGLFELRGNTDYRAEGSQSFLILDDRRKLRGTPGKFRLMLWEELQPWTRPAAEARGWSSVKSVFRA